MKTHDITFTDDAIKQAKIYAEEPGYAGLDVRVYVEGKGCSGFTYGVSFDKATVEDAISEQDGIKIIVDPGSLTFLRGSIVEWVDDERGAGFLVENPKASKFKKVLQKKKLA